VFFKGFSVLLDGFYGGLDALFLIGYYGALGLF
jgi:hypothetical protein